MYKRILLPIDGSALAEQALPYAIAQAERFDAELILLRVLEPIAPMKQWWNESSLPQSRSLAISPAIALGFCLSFL
jgi:nucleotide-binding universal stress UspA family protein